MTKHATFFLKFKLANHLWIVDLFHLNVSIMSKSTHKLHTHTHTYKHTCHIWFYSKSDHVKDESGRLQRKCDFFPRIPLCSDFKYWLFFSGNLLLFKLPTYQAGFSAGTLNIRDMFLYIFLRFIHILFERRNKSTWFKSLHKLMCPYKLYINHKEILSLYSLSLLSAISGVQCVFTCTVDLFI